MYSLLEKSGWFFSLQVASSSVASGSLAMLEASDPMCLGDVAVGLPALLGHSEFQVHIDDLEHRLLQR